jgi:outer membrane biosynthesis protein TonB
MHRKFYLHAHPGSSIIDEVTKVATPTSLFTRDWEDPIRVIPTIQFFPETKELIEGDVAIRAYLDTLRPRPMARERTLAPIKTTPPPPPPPKTKEVPKTKEAPAPTTKADARAPTKEAPKTKEADVPAPTKEAPKTKEADAPAPKEEPKAQTNDEVLKAVRSQLTEELQKAKPKTTRKRKTINVKQAT